MKIDVRMSDFQIGCEAFARDCIVMATIILALAMLMACWYGILSGLNADLGKICLSSKAY